MRVRIRRIAKWGCLSLGSVMLIAAVVGCWWYVGYFCHAEMCSFTTTTSFSVHTGELRVMRFEYLSPWPVGSPGSSSPEFVAGFSQYVVWERAMDGPWRVPSWSGGPFVQMVTIPMSNLALLMLAPGVILWRLDRRRAAHECPKCRYDRRGLAEGAVCPECGTAAPVAPERTA